MISYSKEQQTGRKRVIPKTRISSVSSTNSYRGVGGERYTSAECEEMIRGAKSAKVDSMMEKYGYIFCEECGINSSSGVMIDCSHDVSVYELKKSGRADELSDPDNITMRCRNCHNRYDKLDLKFGG